MLVIWLIVSSFFFKTVRRFAENYFFVEFYMKYRRNENLMMLLVAVLL